MLYFYNFFIYVYFLYYVYIFICLISIGTIHEMKRAKKFLHFQLCLICFIAKFKQICTAELTAKYVHNKYMFSKRLLPLTVEHTQPSNFAVYRVH